MNVKKILNTIITVILFFVCSLNVYASGKAQNKEFMDNHSEMLKSIKEHSEDIQKKGNVEKDFIEEIIYLNAIQKYMAENIIKFSDDENVRRISKKLIKSSMECNNELEESRVYVNKKDSTSKSNEDEYIEKYKRIYNKMILSLECRHEDENIEKIFLRSSIKQHEVLIEVTELFDRYNEDERIKKVSSDMRDRSLEELKKLKKAFKKSS